MTAGPGLPGFMCESVRHADYAYQHMPGQMADPPPEKSPVRLLIRPTPGGGGRCLEHGKPLAVAPARRCSSFPGMRRVDRAGQCHASTAMSKARTSWADGQGEVPTSSTMGSKQSQALCNVVLVCAVGFESSALPAHCLIGFFSSLLPLPGHHTWNLRETVSSRLGTSSNPSGSRAEVQIAS